MRYRCKAFFMRIIFPSVFVAALVFLTACDNHEQPVDFSANDSASKQPLYPFPQYLADELAYIDTMPLAIARIVKLNGATIDSGWIDKSHFKQAISFFTSIDPNKSALRPYYKETSFNDLSIDALTFSITATDSSLPLQQADILLNPSNQKVKSLMLQLQQSHEDSTVISRILWQHHQKCQVVQTVDYKDGHSSNRITEFIWDKAF